MKTNNKTLTDLALLLAVTLIAYFPVSTFLYSLKNDSLVQYLPFRYHLSESIQHGHFPFWSPYLYTGFPIHADMQGMTWNPIVLIISLFTRYNMSVLELEVTIYLVLSAFGMYGLLRSFSMNRITCLLGGICYMSCGFINGSASVIPWISSAAFIPFVLAALKKILENPDLKNSLLFGGTLSVLFLCGYPSFFIFTCYLILFILIFSLVINLRNKTNRSLGRHFLFFGISFLLFLLLCSPAILSYWEFLPYYNRGSGITVTKAAENPFTPYSNLSFFLPNLVHKPHAWLNTDPSMRNSYVGLFVLGLFGLFLFSRKDKWQKLILGLTLFSFLLSLGNFTPLHKIIYYFLPLFDTFRHPGNLRLFTSIGIIVLAAFYMNSLSKQAPEEVRKKLVRAGYFLTGILILPVAYSLFFQSGVFSNIKNALGSGEAKSLLDNLSFPSMMLIQAALQLFFTGLLIIQLRRKTIHTKLIAFLFTANSVLFCWIALPFTFISKERTRAVNNYVNAFPDGYPYPDIQTSAGSNVYSDSSKIPLYGYPNFYSKKISIQDHVITPTLNKDYESFLSNHKLRSLLSDYPFAWLSDSLVKSLPDSTDSGKRISLMDEKDLKAEWPVHFTKGTVGLTGFGPNKFQFSVQSTGPAFLNLFQQFNHNWKLFINEKPAPILKTNLAFMGTPVPEGQNELRFEYRPYKIIIAAWIASVVFLASILFFCFSFFRTKKTG